jgi:type IV pilus assembly protein PilX
MRHPEQKGFVLFVVMIFLIVMSLLGITMFGGFIKDQRNAGNMREKQRAIEAAQAALDNVEGWMSQQSNLYVGNWADGVPCSTVGQSTDDPVVCSNPLLTPTTLPWTTAYQVFQPGSLTVNTAGGASSYASSASYYIQYLGQTSANPPTALYKVTASALGGNATAAAVVETVYEVKSTSRTLSEL